MHKSWKIEYVEDSLNRTDFVTWVKSHKIQYNIPKLTKLYQYFLNTLYKL